MSKVLQHGGSFEVEAAGGRVTEVEVAGGRVTEGEAAAATSSGTQESIQRAALPMIYNV